MLTGSFWLTGSLSPVRITPCSPQATKQQSPQSQGSLQPSKTCALDLHPWRAFLCSCTVASSDLIRMPPFIPLSQTASGSPRAAHNLIYSWSACPNTEFLLLCLHGLALHLPHHTAGLGARQPVGKPCLHTQTAGLGSACLLNVNPTTCSSEPLHSGLGTPGWRAVCRVLPHTVAVLPQGRGSPGQNTGANSLQFGAEI